jgi:hypothetical protein
VKRRAFEVHEMSNALALAALEQCRMNLRAARIDMETATHRVTGHRAARVNELAEMVSDALCFVERLCFLIEADDRYEQRRDHTKHRGENTS